MLLPLPSTCYNIFSIEMINPNYMTHLDHVVRIIITCLVLTEKMRSGKCTTVQSVESSIPQLTI